MFQMLRVRPEPDSSTTPLLPATPTFKSNTAPTSKRKQKSRAQSARVEKPCDISDSNSNQSSTNATDALSVLQVRSLGFPTTAQLP